MVVTGWGFDEVSPKILIYPLWWGSVFPWYCHHQGGASMRFHCPKFPPLKTHCPHFLTFFPWYHQKQTLFWLSSKPSACKLCYFLSSILLFECWYIFACSCDCRQQRGMIPMPPHQTHCRLNSLQFVQFISYSLWYLLQEQFISDLFIHSRSWSFQFCPDLPAIWYLQ